MKCSRNKIQDICFEHASEFIKACLITQREFSNESDDTSDEVNEDNGQETSGMSITCDEFKQEWQEIVNSLRLRADGTQYPRPDVFKKTLNNGSVWVLDKDKYVDYENKVFKISPLFPSVVHFGERELKPYYPSLEFDRFSDPYFICDRCLQASSSLEEHHQHNQSCDTINDPIISRGEILHTLGEYTIILLQNTEDRIPNLIQLGSLFELRYKPLGMVVGLDFEVMAVLKHNRIVSYYVKPIHLIDDAYLSASMVVFAKEEETDLLRFMITSAYNSAGLQGISGDISKPYSPLMEKLLKEFWVQSIVLHTYRTVTPQSSLITIDLNSYITKISRSSGIQIQHLCSVLVREPSPYSTKLGARFQTMGKRNWYQNPIRTWYTISFSNNKLKWQIKINWLLLSAEYDRTINIPVKSPSITTAFVNKLTTGGLEDVIESGMLQRDEIILQILDCQPVQSKEYLSCNVTDGKVCARAYFYGPENMALLSEKFAIFRTNMIAPNDAGLKLALYFDIRNFTIVHKGSEVGRQLRIVPKIGLAEIDRMFVLKSLSNHDKDFQTSSFHKVLNAKPGDIVDLFGHIVGETIIHSNDECEGFCKRFALLNQSNEGIWVDTISSLTDELNLVVGNYVAIKGAEVKESVSHLQAVVEIKTMMQVVIEPQLKKYFKKSTSTSTCLDDVYISLK